MNLLQNRSLLLLSLFSILLLAPLSAFAAMDLNMPEGVSTISKEIYSLHMYILYIVCAIGVVVYGGILYTLFAYRKSKGHEPAKFSHSLKVELVWTVIPTIILIAIAIPATDTLRKIYDTSESELDIMITGYQWKWHYKYLEEDIGFFSNLSTPIEQYEMGATEEKGENYLLEVDNPMVIPVNTKVRFLLTANDVIHAWWIPDFGVKKDAIPGFINETWVVVEETGTYRGACAELCGRNHGYMPIEVVVKSKEDFAKWVEEQKSGAAEEAAAANKDWSLEDLMARGEDVYKTNCLACHQANGEGMAGVFPALKGSKMVTEDKAAHIDIVLKGKGAMPPFEGLSDVDLAAVITYERNAWGNDTGEIVSPADVAASK
jgi:cytochrome c oxidase subunit 2